MDLATIPTVLRSIIDGETIDFIVKAERKNIPDKFIKLSIVGALWTGMVSTPIVLTIKDLFVEGAISVRSNGVQRYATLDDLSPLFGVGLIVIPCLLVGLAMLGYGLYELFQKGGYFVGTPTRLVQYINDEVKSTDWEQFSGKTRLKKKERLGYLVLELRTGKMVSDDERGEYYLPDQIEMVGIPNLHNIRNNCRMRIKEHEAIAVEY